MGLASFNRMRRERVNKWNIDSEHGKKVQAAIDKEANETQAPETDKDDDVVVIEVEGDD